MRLIIRRTSPNAELPDDITPLYLIDGGIIEVPDDQDIRALGLGSDLIVEEEEKYFLPPLPPRSWASIRTSLPTETDPKRRGPMNMMHVSGVSYALSKGFSGEGTHIGFVDSGIDPTHPDLKGRMMAFIDLVDRDNQTAKDPAGHGTACVGIACGSGHKIAKFHGVAPRANYSMARVMDQTGWGRAGDIIEGLQWLDDVGCDIINVSLGGLLRRYTPLSAACDALAERGRVVTIAAGNMGPMTITAPANAHDCLAVAACDERGRHSSFSSIGPALGKDREDLPKPDVMAWGQNVVLCRASGSNFGMTVNDHYTVADGTSFAAPIIAGMAALHLQSGGSTASFNQQITEYSKPNTSHSPEQEGRGIATIHFISDTNALPIGPPVISYVSGGGCLMAGLTMIGINSR